MTPVRGIILKHPFWRADREAEGARLLSEYGPQAHLGFESPALRQNFLLVASLQRAFFLPRRTFSKISLAFSTGKWHSIYLHAALPQLDRGPDYESGRHRFESYTAHHEFESQTGLPSGFPINYDKNADVRLEHSFLTTSPNWAYTLRQ